MLILLVPIAISCAENRKLTLHVPDFQLGETRQYNTITKKNTELTKNPKLVPLERVDGMFCFPKDEITLLIQDWRRYNARGN